MPPAFDDVTAAYTVSTRADPHVVGRRLGLFAEHNLLPDQLRARRLDNRIAVSIEQPGLSDPRANLLALSMFDSVICAECVVMPASTTGLKVRL